MEMGFDGMRAIPSGCNGRKKRGIDAGEFINR